MWGNLKNPQILLSKVGVADARPLCSKELTLYTEAPHSWIHPTVNYVLLYYVFIGGRGMCKWAQKSNPCYSRVNSTKKLNNIFPSFFFFSDENFLFFFSIHVY